MNIAEKIQPGKCVVCGKEVLPVKWRNKNRWIVPKFCSLKCRAKDAYKRRIEYYRNYWRRNSYKWKTERICALCGKKFIPNVFHQKYCQNPCNTSRAFKKKASEENKKKWQVERICANCGKPFIPQCKAQIYCHNPCDRKGQLLPEKKKCLFCGKEFVATSKYKYCSASCRRKADYYKHREKRVAYSIQWTKKSRKENPELWRWYTRKRKHLMRANDGSFTREEWEEIKKAQNYRCAICGKIEEELIKETGVGLTIDHIIPISKGGKHCKENIQALCLRCNARKNNKLVKLPFRTQPFTQVVW